jgi:hypothetical protein
MFITYTHKITCGEVKYFLGRICFSTTTVPTAAQCCPLHTGLPQMVHSEPSDQVTVWSAMFETPQNPYRDCATIVTITIKCLHFNNILSFGKRRSRDTKCGWQWQYAASNFVFLATNSCTDKTRAGALSQRRIRSSESRLSGVFCSEVN